MKIPILLALLLATNTNANVMESLGTSAGAAVGTAVAGPIGGAVGGAIGESALPYAVDSAIEWAQDNKYIDHVPDRNIPILQESKSMIEPWLKEIRIQIEGMEHTMREQHHHFADFIVGSVTEYIEKNSPIIAKMQDIQKIINRINFRYQRMQTYKKRKTFEKATLTNFADDTLTVIHDWLDELHTTLLGNEDRPHMSLNNLLVQLDTALKVSTSHMCRSRQSAQQFFYLLHEDIAFTELKALALADFSWMLLKEKGEFIEEKTLMREEYERRTNRTLRLFKDVISRADRTLWRCDPPHHKSGVTYEEVTRLLQGYIENEVDLNRDGTCRHNCAYYNYASYHGCYYDEEFCAKQPACSGRVLNCKFVESTMQVCLAAWNSNRRYDFVHYDSGHRYGQWGQCSRHTEEADSWHRWIFWHCSYCMCLCDEQGPKSDRYFNLRPVTADVEANRVVTGLRFVKHNRVLHLQIQEGELLPKGVINQTTLQWKPVDKYSITDRNVRQHVDYHMLIHDRRSIDLNELKPLSNNFLISGLRFRNVGGHLHLEAQYTEFAFQSGKLIEPRKKSYWETGGSYQGSGKLILGSTHVSTLTTSSMPFPKNYKYVDFTHTGFEQDAAQTTVPFIDIQEVVSYPAVPLSGIGIYYKGRPGFGGFLGPKIINFDYAPYLS